MATPDIRVGFSPASPDIVQISIRAPFRSDQGTLINTREHRCVKCSVTLSRTISSAGGTKLLTSCFHSPAPRQHNVFRPKPPALIIVRFDAFHKPELNYDCCGKFWWHPLIEEKKKRKKKKTPDTSKHAKCYGAVIANTQRRMENREKESS